MGVSVSKAHWEWIYENKDPTEVSWYQAAPELSLKLIDETGLGREAPIIDVGGGASQLAARLLDAGYSDVTVADISATALARAREAIGDRARAISWVEADVRDHDFGREYSLWHDRAVFHFMVDPDDRKLYLETLRRSLRPGGHVVIAGFGPDGPERCSGLPVARYDGLELAATLGDEYQLITAESEVHITPSDARQEFVYAHLRRAGTAHQLLSSAHSRLQRLTPSDVHRAVERVAAGLPINRR
jgi:SAM-dependent methyltransferase